MSAIFKREFRTYFHSPLGYVFLALIYFFASLSFRSLLQAGVSDIGYIFSGLFTIVIIVIPFITMRLLSEDQKLKTDQLLLTSPTNIGSIVWGKYFSAFVMYFIGICCTLVFAIILSAFSPMNWNIFLGNFLGLALFGAAFIAIGLFISSLTESQVIAAVVTYAVVIFIMFYDNLISGIPTTLTWLSKFLEDMSFFKRYNDLTGGVLNISHVIFFVSVVVIFNFLTVRVLERKRWS